LWRADEKSVGRHRFALGVVGLCPLEVSSCCVSSPSEGPFRYEGKVVSSGFSDQLVQVLPTMVKALFEDFPGQSGSTRTSSQVTHNAAVFGNFL
jgi:hypothetical protein